MEHALKGKVVVIPSSGAAWGATVVELLSAEGCHLGLGAPPPHFETLDAALDGREGTHCHPVDLDRAQSVNEFFQVAFAQLGPPDVIVLEALCRTRRTTAEKAIDIATRRLLHCLDAVLPYVGKDLHFIFIAPAYGPAAIPIATAFLAAKESSCGAKPAPRVRLSAVSPSPSLRYRADKISFARSLVHLMREPQSPDISEARLLPIRRRRRDALKVANESKAKLGAMLQ